MNQRLIVAVSGASGACYARALLLRLAAMPRVYEQCVTVFSDTAKTVWEHELGDTSYRELPFTNYAVDDFFAPCASGSAGFDTMIVCPCSMGSLGRMASGLANDLIARAADVMLKERKKLILVTREAPLNLIHLRNMTALTEAGAIIYPASPSFYHRSENIDTLIGTVTERVLHMAGLPVQFQAWGSDLA